jgi:predicted nucleic acid-binding protein
VPHSIDTNVAIYAFERGEKFLPALAVMEGATISIQVLNEFANVAIKKFAYSSEKLESRIGAIRSIIHAIEPIDEATHDVARDIADRYKLNFYDSLHLAAARLAECDTFYSEDMHDGLVIEGHLTIRNPFV